MFKKIHVYRHLKMNCVWHTDHRIHIYICQGKFITEVFDKRDNFNFNIVNYPYMCSNIPTKPTYGVYISQLISESVINLIILLRDIDYLLIS